MKCSYIKKDSLICLIQIKYKLCMEKYGIINPKTNRLHCRTRKNM